MSQSITSAVAVPPMLWIPHQLVGAPLGYSVTLECYTEAHPTSLNYWAREDGLMIHESNKYKATSAPDRPSYKTHMTLTISDIQVSGCLPPRMFYLSFFLFAIQNSWILETLSARPETFVRFLTCLQLHGTSTWQNQVFSCRKKKNNIKQISNAMLFALSTCCAKT